MKKWFRFVLPIILIAALFFLVGYFKSYHLPKIKKWALIEIEEYSNQHLPVRIWPQNIEVSLFPFKVQFEEIKIFPKSELASTFTAFTIDKIQMNFSPWSLFTGNFRFGDLIVDGATLQGQIDEKLWNQFTSKDQSTPSAPIDMSFLEDLPIDNIFITRFDLLFRIKPLSTSYRIDNLNLELNNLGDRFRIHFSTDGIHVKKSSEDPILSLLLSTNFVVDSEKVIVTALKVKKQNSFIVGTAQVNGDILNGDLKNLEAKIRTDLSLDEIENISSEIFPDYILPRLSGNLQGDFDILYDFKDNLNIEFQIKNEGLVYENYHLGKSELQGKITRDNINITSANIKHSSGQIDIEDLNLSINKKMTLSTNLNLKKININKMLRSLHIDEAAIDSTVDADIPCYGEISPHLLITCKGWTKIHNLTIWDDNLKKEKMIEVSPTQLIGKFIIDSKKISYESDIKINESTGHSKGTIDFEKGFDIFYKGKIHNIRNDIKALVGLNIEGQAQVEGRTWGNASRGRISLNFNGKNLWLDNFGLGNPKFKLNYKDGNLSFLDISSQHQSTRFKGKVQLNLKNNLINIDMLAPFIDAPDIMHLLSRVAPLPIPIKGTGSAVIKAKGPLRLNHLSYDLQASLFRGSISKENFDQFNFDIVSKNGFVESRNVVLTKADGSIELKGKVNQEGTLDAVILGEKLRLEQSEYLKSVGLNLGGQFDFTMAMRGPILSPNTELHGRLSRTMIADIPENDSTFWLRLNNNSLEGKGKFLGQVVQTEFKIPYTENEALKIHINTQEWNFAHLFSMLSGSDIQRDYITTLTSQVKIDSPNNWIWNSSGGINIQKIKLAKGAHSLENSDPIEIDINNGVVNSKKLRLDGPNSFFEAQIKDSHRQNINLVINGKFNLSLLTLFTPFLDDLQGTGSLALKLSGPAEKPDLLGSSYIQDGGLRLKGLKHAFENFTTDLLFNPSTIMINAFKSDFARGRLTGSGQVKFNSLKDIPIDIRGQFKGVELDIPDGFKTRGDGNIQIKGSRSPYILKVDYNINGGNIRANLTDGASETHRIQPSDFLPKFISEENLDPIHLDIQLNLPKSLPVDLFVPEAQVKANISGGLRVTQSPNKPLLKGNIKTLPGGTFLFRNNIFDLANAIVDYDHSPPENPQLLITATSNIRSKLQASDIESTGEEYQVTLDIQGTPKNLIINMSSQPILSEPDIISLLAFGITSTRYQQLDSSQQAIQSGVEVGAQFVKQKLGLTKALESTTGFNFNISSVMDDESAAPRFSANRQFTPKFGMSISRTEGKLPRSEMRFEYRFNQKFSVVGELERQEAGNTNTDSTARSQEKVGLDLEYKFQFK